MARYTVTKYPQSASWDTGSNPENIYTDDGNYATTLPPSGSSYTLTTYNFGFDLPSGSAVNSVSVETQYKVSTNAMYNGLTISIRQNNVTVGNLGVDDSRPLADKVVTLNSTYKGFITSKLNSSDYLDFSVRLNCYKITSGTPCTFYLDYCKVTVDYSPDEQVGDLSQGDDITAEGTAEITGYPYPSIVEGKISAVGQAVLMPYTDVDKVLLYDASVPSHTDYTTPANEDTADDVPCLPSSIGVNDALRILMGFDVASGIYGLLVNITTAGVGTYTLAWEYYNGAWVSLNAYIANFASANPNWKTAGANKVDIMQPPDMAEVDCGGIVGKWIQIRYVSGTMTTQPKAGRIRVYEHVSYVTSISYDETGKLQAIPIVLSKSDIANRYELNRLQAIPVVLAEIDISSGDDIGKSQVINVVQSKTDIQANIESSKLQNIPVVLSSTDVIEYIESQLQIILAIQSKTDLFGIFELNREQVIPVVVTEIDVAQFGELNKSQVILVIQTETDRMSAYEAGKLQIILVVQSQSDHLILEEIQKQAIPVVITETDIQNVNESGKLIDIPVVIGKTDIQQMLESNKLVLIPVVQGSIDEHIDGSLAIRFETTKPRLQFYSKKPHIDNDTEKPDIEFFSKKPHIEKTTKKPYIRLVGK